MLDFRSAALGGVSARYHGGKAIHRIQPAARDCHGVRGHLAVDSGDLLVGRFYVSWTFSELGHISKVPCSPSGMES